jgi:cytochrome c oxidase assembly factor CtaG
MHLRPLPLVITSVLVVGGLVYLRGWLCLRKALPKLIAGWQLAAFMSGLFTTWTAVASPLATLDHQSLTIHMMKHLLLMTVAAPLILAGAPIFPLMCGLPKLFITGDPPVRNWRARWLEHLPAHFVSCWLAGTVAVISWHLPGPFQLAMRSYWVKGTEEACFLFAGILFWSPIVQPLPSIRSCSSMVQGSIPFPRHITLRRSFWVLGVLQSPRLLRLPVCDSIVQSASSSRPRVRGGAYVGLDHVCVLDPFSCHHNADTHTTT